MNAYTDEAVLAQFPCLPVPPSGICQKITALRSGRTSQGLIVGREGSMLIIRRPWLAMDIPIAINHGAYLPFGSIGQPKAELLCGKIPHWIWTDILDAFESALPNESAAFVIWNDRTLEFDVVYPQIISATPSRLEYRPPVCTSNQHVILDVHSHGYAGAFFSSTDNIDDRHSTKISMVIGKLGGTTPPTIRQRICAGGDFHPIHQNPFSEDEENA